MRKYFTKLIDEAMNYMNVVGMNGVEVGRGFNGKVEKV